MVLSQYCKIYLHPEDRGLVTLFSTRTMAVANIATEVLRDIEHNKLSVKEKKTLDELGFLAQNAAAERREMLGSIEDLNDEDESFSAVVVLSLDCNLGCKYCFEGRRKGKFYMSAETADRFVDFITTQELDGKDELHVVFYGGEPLLSMDIICRISEKLRIIAKKRKVKFKFSLITNGTLLTRRNLEILEPLGLEKASVTLDGPREVHDAFRPFKSGKGSFDAIISNVERACSLIDVNINGNYTVANFLEFPRLLDYLLDRGLTPDKIAAVDFSPVINERDEFAPLDFHDGCISLNEPWLCEATLFLREEILKRGFPTQELLPTICAIERRNSIIVNFDGTLYKCPVLIGKKDFCVGDLKTGALDYSRTHCLGNWKNEVCLACSYLPLCFGGCRHMKLMQDGTMNGVNCRKEYFDKTLAQFVSQDIKYDL